MTGDGSVTQIRRPDNCVATPAYLHDYEACAYESPPIGFGPDGGLWMNGSDRLLRFDASGVRVFDVVPSPDHSPQIIAFAANSSGVVSSRAGETGLRLRDRNGSERRLLRDVGYVTQAVMRTEDGAMWLLTRTAGAPNWKDRLSLVLAHSTGITRNIAANRPALHRSDPRALAAAANDQFRKRRVAARSIWARQCAPQLTGQQGICYVDLDIEQPEVIRHDPFMSHRTRFILAGRRDRAIRRSVARVGRAVQSGGDAHSRRNGWEHRSGVLAALTQRRRPPESDHRRSRFADQREYRRKRYENRDSQAMCSSTILQLNPRRH
jgi:hypothetical protein